MQQRQRQRRQVVAPGGEEGLRGITEHPVGDLDVLGVSQSAGMGEDELRVTSLGSPPGAPARSSRLPGRAR